MKRPPASDDVRARALAAIDAGRRVADVAAFFQNEPSTVRRRDTGSGLSRPRSGRPRLIPPDQEAALLALVATAPDATVAMHCQQWQATHGVALSVSAMSRRLRALGLTLKKKTLIAGEQDAAARAAWQEDVAGLDPTTLVFLDETSTPTTLTPTRARARRGVRVIGQVPRRWQAVTLLATLTPAGLGPGLQLEGAIDRHRFDTFVTQVLVPTLRPGQTVILDNLSVHKSPQAQAAIEAVGCTLRFLPAYAPDFNPIEQAFSKLKHLLRQAEARTVETILTATEAAYPQITDKDTRGYYQDSGYNL